MRRVPVAGSLALGLWCLGAGQAQAQAEGMSPTEALDRVSAAASEWVSRSVVLIEVERPNYGPQLLTQQQRMGLGVGAAYDPAFFNRPEGPCSGVVIDEDLIATARWNLDEGTAFTVVAPDGRRLEAERLGEDPNLDVALLRVAGLGLQPVERSEADLEPGRFVLLVSRTAENRVLMTRGTVSGLGRHRGDAFAHSARTNFASVGGALVDLEGRLLGVSVRHSDRVRQLQNSGVGFGAAVSPLRGVLPQLAAGESIPLRPTPFLGIQADIRAQGEGVRIAEALDGMAAQEAGIQDGDWIKIFNQVEIKTFEQLREEIQALAVGTEIVVTIERDGELMDFRVQLGARDEEQQ